MRPARSSLTSAQAFDGALRRRLVPERAGRRVFTKLEPVPHFRIGKIRSKSNLAVIRSREWLRGDNH